MIKAIVVDDESPARSELRFLLGELGDVDVVAEASYVREAIEQLKIHPCDVLFLDINMPEVTGLRLAEALQKLKVSPAVVFVTAYSDHAIDAFNLNAVDYLLKPVEAERLAQAIARVREHISLRARAQKTERLLLNNGVKKFFVGVDEIRFIEAHDDYAYVYTEACRYYTAITLTQLEERLGRQGFFRVHRCYMVNLSMVEAVEPASSGTLLLTLSGVGEKIPVSRRRATDLKKALGI